MTDGAIRIVVVDDHRIFREGLLALLASAPDTDVVGDAGSGEDALEVVGAAEPDVVLMDIAIPGMSGIEATRRLHADHPTVNVVMLTMLEDDDSLFAAMCAGARGYLLKGADTDEVLKTVRAVAPYPQLTDREREVLAQVADGHDNATIARTLYISTKTVSNNVSDILTKLHLTDRAHAIAAAREAGLGHTPPPERPA